MSRPAIVPIHHQPPLPTRPAIRFRLAAVPVVTTCGFGTNSFFQLAVQGLSFIPFARMHVHVHVHIDRPAPDLAWPIFPCVAATFPANHQGKTRAVRPAPMERTPDGDRAADGRARGRCRLCNSPWISGRCRGEGCPNATRVRNRDRSPYAWRGQRQARSEPAATAAARQAPPSGEAATEVIVIDAVEPLADREEDSTSAKRVQSSAASSTEPGERSQSMQSSRPPTADASTMTEPTPESEGAEVSGSQLHAGPAPDDMNQADTQQ